MSDYNDIVFDYRQHTHTNCVDEIENADIVVLIIGGRFGSRAVPQALEQVDLEKLKDVSRNSEFLKAKHNLSVTQLEVMKAIEVGIPVFAFIEDRVLHDHATGRPTARRAWAARRAAGGPGDRRRVLYAFVAWIEFRRA
jgi:Domain of unknown function (DUF4062)